MLVHQIWGLMRTLRFEKLLLCAGLLVQLLSLSGNHWVSVGLGCFQVEVAQNHYYY